MKSTFLREMQERGYLNQCTDLEKLEETATEELDESSEKFSPGRFAGKLKTLLERK